MVVALAAVEARSGGAERSNVVATSAYAALDCSAFPAILIVSAMSVLPERVSKSTHKCSRTVNALAFVDRVVLALAVQIEKPELHALLQAGIDILHLFCNGEATRDEERVHFLHAKTSLVALAGRLSFRECSERGSRIPGEGGLRKRVARLREGADEGSKARTDGSQVCGKLVQLL